jgi:hypothetical protein
VASFRKRRGSSFMADGRYPGSEHRRVATRTFHRSAFGGLPDINSWRDGGPSRDEPPVDALTHPVFD